MEGVVTQAIKVCMEIPTTILVDATPRIGWWNDVDERWSEEGISEIACDSEKRILTFHTIKLTSLAILQKRNLNFALLNWKVQVDEGVGHFLCATRKYPRIHVEIAEGSCKLLEPILPPLSVLNSTFFPPGEFLQRLSAAGINLTPSLSDDVLFQHTPKSFVLESKLCTEMVRVASSFEISSSRHEDLSEDWQQLAEQSNCCVLRIQKNKSLEEEMSPEVNEGSDEQQELLDAETQVAVEKNGPDEPEMSDLINKKEEDPSEDQVEDEQPTGVIELKYQHVLAEIDDEVPGQVKFRLYPVNDNPDSKYNTHLYLPETLHELKTTEVGAEDASSALFGNDSSVLFENTLKQFLFLVRPFSYCIPANGQRGSLNMEDLVTPLSEIDGVSIQSEKEYEDDLISNELQLVEEAENEED